MTMFYAFGVKRRSDASYSHASRDERGVVRFHKTYEAAARRAGRYGYVAPASLDPAQVNSTGWRAPAYARRG